MDLLAAGVRPFSTPFFLGLASPRSREARMLVRASTRASASTRTHGLEKQRAPPCSAGRAPTAAIMKRIAGSYKQKGRPVTKDRDGARITITTC